MPQPPPNDLPSLEHVLGQAAWLHRCALRMGYRTEPAEDAVQETLLLAAQAEPRTLGPGWLSRTLQRRLGMELRAERRRSHRERAAARPEAVHLDPAAALEQLEFQREVHEAIAKLPRRRQEVLALRFVADLSVQEIATSLGETPNAVSSRLSRALTELRSSLSSSQGPSARWSVLGGSFLPGAKASVGAQGSPIHVPLAAAMNLLMKKILVALAVLACLTLGSLALLRNAPEKQGVDPAVAGARVAQAPSSDGPLAEVQLTSPVETDRSDLRADAATAEEATGRADENPVPGSEFGTVHVSCREAGSATPVAGIAVELRRTGRDVLTQNLTLVRVTDERGCATFKSVGAGPVSAILTRFGGRHSAVVSLQAGETAEIHLDVDPRQETRGVVVNEDGQPVANAELWLGHRPGPVDTAYLVGRSGARGEFALRYCDHDQFLCARAKGYAPSHSAAPSWVENYETEGLRLVLGIRHGGLHGTVRSQDGEPQRDVLVTLGDMIAPAPGPGYRWTAIPQSQFTNADGRFEFHGLRVGEIAVRARAPRAAPWTGSASITDGGTTELVIELSRGGTLAGRVISANGQPAAGARIAAYMEEDARLPQAFTRADAEGLYRLTNLSSGEQVFEVESDDRRTKVRESLFIHDGTEQEWNPVLSQTAILEGFVVSEGGSPLAGWYVSARPAVDGVFARSSSGASTGPDGSFSIEPQPGEQYELRVFPPGRFVGPEACRLEGLELGGEPTTLTVPHGSVPTASVRGVLVNDAGEPHPARVELTIRSKPPTRLKQTTAEDGRFRFSYLPEGPFTVSVTLADGSSSEIQSDGDLTRDETRDLGRVTPR